jgi:glycine cleavage system H protein
MSAPAELKYSQTHEWVKIDEDEVIIGITDHAQDELGDVALVTLPKVGEVLKFDAVFGEIESIKAVSDLYTPVSGEVVEVNVSLADLPELINNDPYGDGWLIKIKLANPAELDDLMDAPGYEAFLEEL